MKRFKSILIGSAASLFTAGLASAGDVPDLPVRHAAPVEYVQVCSHFGAGFFHVPGADTCLRVGGLVRYQAELNDTGWMAGLPDNAFTPTMGRMQNQVSQSARAAIQLDARTATAHGTLRSYAEMFVTDDGTAEIDSAFVEFAGFTFGQRASYFRGFDEPMFRGGLWMPENIAPLAAYTADFGPARFTVSAERARTMTSGITGIGGVYLNMNGDFLGSEFTSASRGIPDLVASMQYDGGPYTLHLAGALSEIRSAPTPNVLVQNNDARSIPGTTYGYALTAGISYEIMPTTRVNLQGAYASGAMSYLGLGAANRRLDTRMSDAFITPTGGLSRNEAWVINASASHEWAPDIRQMVYGGYGEYTSAIRMDAVTLGNSTGVSTLWPGNFTSWSLGTRLDWMPVSGLTVSGDVNYLATERSRRVFTHLTDSGLATTRNDDRWTATLRVERSF